MVILLLHKVAEVCRVEIRAQVLEHFVERGLVFVLAHARIEAHVVLHLRVVLVHKLAHPVRHIVLSLALDRILVILQLASEQISLLMLKLYALAFSVLNAGEALDIIFVDPTVADAVGVSEPDVVAVVAHELGLHLEHLDLAHLLQVVAHFEALHVRVPLELPLPQQGHLVFQPEFFVADLSRRRLVVCLIQRCSKLDGDIVRSGFGISKDA
mmetsp:Transcript_23365/g.28980  ORF Transcript_23365/g.28980 Transcript_23365/m.28980 type:complete len:212 (-) Transcript_23365:1308-1943(-)